MENWASEKWNEYDWEREIRRDERRIGCYFDLLPNCIDLPNEEDNIYSRIMSRSDLIPKGVSVNNWSGENIFSSEESGGFDFVEIHQRDGGGFLVGVEKCAVMWNRILALELDDNYKIDGIRIVCGFGKLISRLAGVYECRIENNVPVLELTLFKRVLADLSEVYGMLADFLPRMDNPKIHAELTAILNKMLALQVGMVDELIAMRNNGNNNK
ncbi:MAG: hypothetical protein RRY34_03320, partial [Victivallaceae bacterium]